jgi:hypothetical protein
MKQKFVFVDRNTGKKYSAMIDPMPVCPDCPEQTFGGGLGPARYQRHFDKSTRVLRFSCGNCGKGLAEYQAAETGG